MEVVLFLAVQGVIFHLVFFKDNYANNYNDSGMSVKTDWDSSTNIENSIFISTKNYANSAHISILRGRLTSYNNLFFGSKSYSLELYEGTANVYNCIFVHSRTNLKGDSNSKFIIYNSFINTNKNTGAFSNYFKDNIFLNENLGLKDSTVYDFHLTKQSTLIDKGVSNVGAKDTLDFDGNKRILGKTIDIGPYEINAESTNLPKQSNNTVIVYSIQNFIIIDGTSNGEKIEIYTLNGKLIDSQKSEGERMVIPAKTEAVYLVKTSGKTCKVIL